MGAVVYFFRTSSDSSGSTWWPFWPPSSLVLSVSLRLGRFGPFEHHFVMTCPFSTDPTTVIHGFVLSPPLSHVCLWLCFLQFHEYLQSFVTLICAHYFALQSSTMYVCHGSWNYLGSFVTLICAYYLRSFFRLYCPILKLSFYWNALTVRTQILVPTVESMFVFRIVLLKWVTGQRSKLAFRSYDVTINWHK